MNKMDQTVNRSLQKIAKGSSLILIGTILGMLLGFISRVIIIRYISQAEYGIFSLCLVIFNIATTIAVLGLGTGVPRQIGFYMGRGDIPRARKIALYSTQIGLGASATCALILLFTSNIIATNIYNIPELSEPLKIFAIAIPFYVFIRVTAATFLGFNNTKPQIYFDNIFRNLAFVILIVMALLIYNSYLGVVYSFTASIIVTAIACLVYFQKKSPLPQITGPIQPSSGVRKELLLFSLPLLAIMMFNQIITWLDTLLLGHYMKPEDVGLYNGVIPLVQILPVILTAVRFLYVPMMSELYAKNETGQIRKSYVMLTKWSFSATLPLFLIFILFPEATLNTLFGSKYADASSTLQILSLGYFISVMLGPNGPTLTILGKTTTLLTSVLVAVAINIALNIALIPPLGIEGAAIATTSALVLTNIIISGRLYLLSKFHPFTRNYLKPVLLSGTIIVILYVTLKSFINPVPIWLLPPLLIFFLIIYGLSILFTRSFDEEDLMMMLAIERKLGINLAAVKKTLKKFL